MPMLVEGVPDGTPVLLPSLGDGIADKQQIDMALTYPGDGAFMPFHPPGFGLRGRHRSADLFC